MPGPAAAQTQPDERAAAREFAYAAYRLRVKLKTTFATKAELQAILTSPGCREIAEETSRSGRGRRRASHWERPSSASSTDGWAPR